jgi:hypothetical protein
MADSDTSRSSDDNAPDAADVDERFGPAVEPSPETLRQLLALKVFLFLVGIVLIGCLVIVVTGV